MQAWYKHIQNMVQAHTEKDTCSSNTIQPCVGLLTAGSTKNASVTTCSLIKGNERNHYMEAHTCFIRAPLCICFDQSAFKPLLRSVSLSLAPSSPLSFTFMWCEHKLTLAEIVRNRMLSHAAEYRFYTQQTSDMWRSVNMHIALSGKVINVSILDNWLKTVCNIYNSRPGIHYIVGTHFPVNMFVNVTQRDEYWYLWRYIYSVRL